MGGAQRPCETPNWLPAPSQLLPPCGTRGVRVAGRRTHLPRSAAPGAKEVVLLDREPLALQCALLSARATGLAAVVALPSGLDPASGSSLGGPEAAEAAAAADAVAAERRASHAQAGSSSGGGGGGGGDAARSGGCAVRAAVFDWGRAPQLPRFDVVLACDVLYEPEAVAPISEVVPRLLKSSGGLLLLADPPNRTAANRERFLALLREGPTPFAVDECYEHRWGPGGGAARAALRGGAGAFCHGPVPAPEVSGLARL
jgi:predicted nicotinamide N-methyase